MLYIGVKIIKSSEYMYKLIQNYLQSDEYEYTKEYTSFSEALKDSDEYITEDKAEGKSFSYTVVDENYDDVAEKEAELFRKMATSAMLDIGLTLDEAEMQLEDIGVY